MAGRAAFRTHGRSTYPSTFVVRLLQILLQLIGTGKVHLDLRSLACSVSLVQYRSFTFLLVRCFSRHAWFDSQSKLQNTVS
jgi:hypothetical protein